jgi:uncharacterized tellurite resistance protein B-like protein|tara:strand:+ start:562 stop:981 length:420 start_codon:yes stop_codon:yes gene_type:complete
MLGIFKNKENTKESSFSKVASLLIYAAKIDEIYTEKEEQIVKKTLLDLGAKSSEIDKLILDAKSLEKNSNQILDFTKEVKNMSELDKNKIIESLWKIIYSNNEADIYEANLMRRLTGLLYVDSKTMGEIKEKVKKQLNK